MLVGSTGPPGLRVKVRSEFRIAPVSTAGFVAAHRLSNRRVKLESALKNLWGDVLFCMVTTGHKHHISPVGRCQYPKKQYLGMVLASKLDNKGEIYVTWRPDKAARQQIASAVHAVVQIQQLFKHIHAPEGGRPSAVVVEATTSEGLERVAMWNAAFLPSEDLGEAASAFATALREHERMGARPWLAFSLRDQAHLLLRRPRTGHWCQNGFPPSSPP